MQRMIARHMDTTVVLFTDGHVKSHKIAYHLAWKATDGVTLASFTVQNDG